MKILISNDDGVNAEGIRALFKEFSRDHECTIVAPERERSTTGHSLTLHKPLRLHRLEKRIYSVSGGPADCILLALTEIYKGRKPDLILSGLNRGANLGQDVFYSGTASAAREGANQGIPSVACSLSLFGHRVGTKLHYTAAAKMVRKCLLRSLDLFGGVKKWPAGMMLNVNVPNLPLKRIKGIGIATQGALVYSADILKRMDFRGRHYYWVGGTYKGFRPIPESDCWYVDKGYVSLTPLELDTTMRPVFLDLRERWGR